MQSALDWVVANQAKYHIAAINLSLGAGNYTVNPYTFLDSDFNALKNSFGRLCGGAGYDYRADYDANYTIGLGDFNSLKNNFGVTPTALYGQHGQRNRDALEGVQRRRPEAGPGQEV